MKTTLTALLAGAAIIAVVPTHTLAQPYGGPPANDYGRGRGDGDNGRGDYGRGGYGDRALAEREANIAQRIDEGERGGGLTREEAARLRGQLRDIQQIEREDMRGGLSDVERRDLNRRLDALSANVDRQRHDQDRQGVEINNRLMQLDQNINDGVRGGGLTRREADRLRAEETGIRDELARDRRTGDGLDARERADLNRRLDSLANHIRQQRRDDQTRR